ncbi:protein-lysine methyltransferase METTL21B-like [Tripterygium wilfordii]|uniref:Protein-lysine methyltransferase METTL21B-like n=1 Tax=Tripterygium wilfordii TaxID=458696 RepID=A0A7J7CVN2_TRIWF|nr:protein N-lysine methyltransferase METTL21A-like [Tripterygium wilfordii]KAF5738160.1 protein-lysine methyltransferase METTL21B-like [Tripterygium wilfordii]
MASQHEDDDEDDIDPIKMLLQNKLEIDNRLPTEHDAEETQRHYIRSIDSTVVIRQLPFEGLSFQLWPAATTLVTLLDNHRVDPTNIALSRTLSTVSKGLDHPKINILELGSGTGLVGIAAASILGANVTVTDLPHVISNLEFNIEANADILTLQGGSVRAKPLRWGEAEDVEKIGRDYDLIMASDVVYHQHLFEPLIETLRLLLGGEERMVFVMAHLKRWKKESAFFKRAKKLFQVETIHVDNPREGSRTGVVVYRFAAKQQKLTIC